MAPYAPFWFDHIPELQFDLRVDRLQVFVETVQQRNTGRDRHPLNIFIADVINVLDQRPDCVGVTNDDALVPRPQGRADDAVKEGHDPICRVLERLCP